MSHDERTEGVGECAGQDGQRTDGGRELDGVHC